MLTQFDPASNVTRLSLDPLLSLGKDTQFRLVAEGEERRRTIERVECSPGFFVTQILIGRRIQVAGRFDSSVPILAPWEPWEEGTPLTVVGEIVDRSRPISIEITTKTTSVRHFCREGVSLETIFRSRLVVSQFDSILRIRGEHAALSLGLASSLIRALEEWKAKVFSENSETEDYEACGECGYDHEYEHDEARREHQRIAERES